MADKGLHAADAVTSAGPLSWQLAMNLRRNAALGVRTANTGAVFALPGDDPMPRLRKRLAGMVERHDVLRIVELPADGYGPVTYVDDIDLPICTTHVDSVEAAGALIYELFRRPFPSHGGPLWMVTAVEHPDRDGQLRRTACAVLDHHVADCISSLLFREAAMGRGTDVSMTQRGKFREWVRWQLSQYPMDDAAAVATPARDFWRRYFDGGAPNRATILPFCVPDAPLSGLEHVMDRELPVPTAAVHQAAGTLACSPLLLVAASLASTVGELTGEDDLTIRYVSHGRTPKVVDTLGWFSDQVPLRIRTGSLAHPRHALRAAVSGWLAMTEYEATPWGYVLGACGVTDAEQPQLVVDLLPRLDTPPDVPSGDRSGAACGSTDRTVPGRRGYLNLTVGLSRAGAGRLECRFDPARFSPDGVQLFLRLAFDRLTQLVAQPP